MNNAAAILRTLVIYAICVPLAVFVGYLLTNPLDYSLLAEFGILAFILVMPILLRWHHWLLLLSWNLNMTLFFLKGAPQPWLVMAAVSLFFSVLQRAMSRQSQFIQVPVIAWSLIFMAAVILATAKLTGGFGLKMLGSEVYGGKKYVMTLGAIAGYFALTAVRIPPEKIKLALALFFLSGLTGVVGELYGWLPHSLDFIFWLFPPDAYSAWNQGTVLRFAGAVAISTAVISYMQARYGIRGIFVVSKPWRWLIYGTFFVGGLMGGFRSFLGTVAAVFVIQFFMEGLHRTKLLPIFGALGLAAAVVILPLAEDMPLPIQRALAFLPVKISPQAKMDAQTSLDWRIEMWQGLWPQIPKHLLLGKGYGFSAEDFQFMGQDTAFHSNDPSQQGLALAGDYHNGWISVLLCFGIWGMIATLWFFGAGLWALFCNYRYGDPALRTVNAFLFASFLVRCVTFLSVAGTGLNNDLAAFVGWLGFGLCLNGGVCRKPAVQPAAQPVEEIRRPTLPRPFPRPRPVFQRQ